jgi:hypothetical protein
LTMHSRTRLQNISSGLFVDRMKSTKKSKNRKSGIFVTYT